MTAMCDITSGFAKVLLKNDLAKTREEHVDEAGEEDEVGFDANGGGSKNGNLPSPPLSPKSVKTGPPFFSDESSLPAIGLQMSQTAAVQLECTMKAVFCYEHYPMGRLLVSMRRHVALKFTVKHDLYFHMYRHPSFQVNRQTRDLFGSRCSKQVCCALLLCLSVVLSLGE